MRVGADQPSGSAQLARRYRVREPSLQPSASRGACRPLDQRSRSPRAAASGEARQSARAVLSRAAHEQAAAQPVNHCDRLRTRREGHAPLPRRPDGPSEPEVRLGASVHSRAPVRSSTHHSLAWKGYLGAGAPAHNQSDLCTRNRHRVNKKRATPSFGRRPSVETDPCGADGVTGARLRSALAARIWNIYGIAAACAHCSYLWAKLCYVMLRTLQPHQAPPTLPFREYVSRCTLIRSGK